MRHDPFDRCKARAAIARCARHVLRYQPSPADKLWRPTCVHCGDTHLFCVALNVDTLGPCPGEMRLFLRIAFFDTCGIHNDMF